MKKKFSVFLLSIIILPLIALFGCGESVSYTINTYVSSSIYGTVSGRGTYSEGSTVTLTAYAINGSYFIGWVFQNTLLSDGGTYSITNTQDSDGAISKSVLTFTSSATTQGSYSAVFNDGNMLYVKLDSFFVSTDSDSDGIEDSDLLSEIMTANIDISQGSTSLTTIYSGQEVSLKDSVLVSTTDVNGVLKLSTSTAQNVRAVCTITYGASAQTFTFNSELYFQESSDTVTYSDNTYKITFNFTLGGQDFYLNLIYKALS